MNLIQYLILSTACLSFSYIAFRLSFEKETRFRQQRLFLVASLTISLLLPLTGFRIDYEDLWGKREETALQIQQLSTVSVQTPVINTGNGNFKIHTDLIVKIYLIITLTFFTYAAIQFIRIVRLYSISKKADRDIGVVLYNENIKSPFSFFRWIFIPKEICDRDERESIILHESIHVSQYHSFDNLLIELVAAVMWFNPLVWMMKKSLHLVHEYLADEGTLNTGIDRLKYQALLLNQVTEERLICLSSSFNNSLIKKRMIMMTKSKNENQNRFKILDRKSVV